MGFEWFVTKLAENWAVISGSAPLSLILAGLLGWVVFRMAQAFAKRELQIQKGLRELAEKETGIAKASVAELEKKILGAATTPYSNKAPSDVVAVVTARPELKRAFTELNSTHGLHLPVDPRPEQMVQVGKYVLSESEVERMAAGRYFFDRGLVGDIQPDVSGSGVTVTASSTAVAAFSEISKSPPIVSEDLSGTIGIKKSS